MIDMRMRFISLFSGIEAASVAWIPLGWTPVAFCEIDPFACAVLRHHYPSVPNLGDITQVDWSVLRGKADVVVGGSPCQSFSIAGKREGLQGQSGLMYEYIRAVREIRPSWFVWENVPGALTVERGEAFRQFLSEMDDLGYGMAWRILDSQFFGVAQRRRRLYAIGHLGDMRAGEVLFESESMCGDHPSSKQKREALARASEGCTGEGREPWAAVAFAQNTRDEVRLVGGNGDLAGAICASPGSKQQTYVLASGQSNAELSRDLAPTLNCDHEQPVVMLKMRHTGTPNKGGGEGAMWGEGVSYTLATHQDQTMFAPTDTGYIVRRLTPTECERLQGFPDAYTDIQYRGKSASDAVRYKALGNSFAVPVVRWIGERIKAAEDGVTGD